MIEISLSLIMLDEWSLQEFSSSEIHVEPKDCELENTISSIV